MTNAKEITQTIVQIQNGRTEVIHDRIDSSSRTRLINDLSAKEADLLKFDDAG